MKFAKELEEDLVPEWRVKYFNYKAGKKKIKAVSRALKEVNRTPKPSARPFGQSARSSDRLPFTHYDFNRRNERTTTTAAATTDTSDNEPTPTSANGKSDAQPVPPAMMRKESLTMFAQSPPIMVPQDDIQSPSHESTTTVDERMPLREHQDMMGRGQPVRYGSFVGTPPEDSPPVRLPSLELPDPALDPSRRKPHATGDDVNSSVVLSRSIGASPDAYHIGQDRTPKKGSHLTRRFFGQGKRSDSSSYANSPSLRRVFTSRPLDSAAVPDVQLEAYRQLDTRQDDFFSFLDLELEKIEKFYKSKEDEHTKRLHLLRDQLHQLRDRRLYDMHLAKDGDKADDRDASDGTMSMLPSIAQNELGKANGHGVKILQPLTGILRHKDKAGKTSKAMEQLGSPPGPQAQSVSNGNQASKDYVRKKDSHDNVPYRFAKRRLKQALQEFYRGLELLKSYALLNRTAFRKINKKYDKATNARPPLRYMADKVNNSHFVQSRVIEGHLMAVEDLYARYFERGNHKLAINKLRSKLRPGDQSGVAFRNGLYLAAGAGFGIVGLVNASGPLFGDDQTLKVQTSYLLQLYAGYFLALLLFLLFVLNCRVWTNARINYQFIFEYDTRHVLDWRQLAELPCFFLFLNGLILWLNFEVSSAHPMFLYWPVLLAAITVAILALPAKTLYFHSRKWWAYSNWRLLLAGVYPVEFRDFYLGDMYCSETYTMSQLEVFFCLYAHDWRNPPRCNSNHSMLLGFFTTLPAIWRALQCLRRYYDSRNWFPHLANFAKYLCNIMYYMTLSLYRLNINNERRAAFITFAAANGIYCSFWDVFMDFSLGNVWSRHRFLRDHLAYRKVWPYYLAIVLDVVLRQQWIFYALFTDDLQHSAAMSFFVALAEVLRRGIWSLFRVENEHTNNVRQFRASRDVPLPYALTKDSPTPDHTRCSEDSLGLVSPAAPAAPGSGVGTAIDIERQQTNDSQATGSSSLRLRRSHPPATPGLRALHRVGTVIAAAHSQDFEKRRRPELESEAHDDHSKEQHSSEDDDDNDDDDDDDHTVSESEDELRRLDSRPERRRDGAAGRSGGLAVPSRGAGSRTSTAQDVRRVYTRATAANEEDLAEVRARNSRARSPR